MFWTCAVHPPSFMRIRLGTAGRRNAIEPGLHDGEHSFLAGRFQAELHERRRLARVVDLRIDRERMPSVGKVVLGLDADDLELCRDVLVPGDEHAAADGPAHR